MALILHKNEIANWYDLVMQAQSKAKIYLDDEIEVYVALLIKKSVKDISMADTIVAMNYLKALNSKAVLAKGKRLKQVADQSLLLSTLFPGRAKHRNVSDTYYASISQSAYACLISLLEETVPVLCDLYKKLLCNFNSIVIVLSALRQNALEYKLSGNPKHRLDLTLSNDIGLHN